MKLVGVLKIIFSIILLLDSPNLIARNIEVISMQQLTLDLSASTKVKVDNNGIPCALLRIYLPIEDCEFEGNIIGTITYKTNEYRIYVSSGTKKIRVMVPDNEPKTINFADFGIDHVDSKSTYEIKIDGEFGVSTKTQMQKLTINYSPKNGTFYLNGTQFSSKDDNGTTSTILPVGTYSYLFVWKDNESSERTKEGIVRLFSSAPKVLNIDEQNIYSSNEEITDEETLFNNAILAIREGDDSKAEQIANQGLAKGYQICNEILAALLFAGYYDDKGLNAKQAIEETIKLYSSNRLNLSEYRSNILNLIYKDTEKES
ncbi:MAG: hypothetical protein NC453_21245 [Muribaculum sp.]|nr:hypothetical protein [Muribaculum sp.]